MYLNLGEPKKVIRPNPDPARMSKFECIEVSLKWFNVAIDFCSRLRFDKEKSEIAFEKAAMYENMAFDGRE